MAQPVHILDGAGKETRALVSAIGQLVVSPFDFSEATFVEFAIANSAYSLIKQRAGQKFVITDIIMGQTRMWVWMGLLWKSMKLHLTIH